MKVAPTLEGGLRIDPETEEDWHILRRSCSTRTAMRPI